MNLDLDEIIIPDVNPSTEYMNYFSLMSHCQLLNISSHVKLGFAAFTVHLNLL